MLFELFFVQLAIEAFTVPVFEGLPGSIYSVLASTADSHFRNLAAMNSGPLSDRICSGTPCTNIRSARVSIRS